MKIIILLFAIFALALATSAPSLSQQWISFKKTHQKQYRSNLEEMQRFNIFRNNIETIRNHNELYKAGQTTYKMGLNQFGDMTTDEFHNQYLNNAFKSDKSDRRKNAVNMKLDERKPRVNDTLPGVIDWRAQGAVNPIKNQKSCGSCWAFSTTGSLESINFLKTGKLISLSEQELVDCAGGTYGNLGCNGGTMESAFQYIHNSGIASESDYPYTAADGECQSTADKVVKVTSYVEIKEDDESDLQAAIATIGPVSIAIDASYWQFYAEGIYYDTNCSPDGLNHGVVGVGYGSDDATGLDYWVIRNSWGTSWGESGYMRAARNRDNNCGVARDASYPVL